MVTTRRLGPWLLALTIGGLGTGTLSARAPDRTPTPFPRLSGGFGRPQATALPSSGNSADDIGSTNRPTAVPSAPSGGGSDRWDSLSFDTKWYDWSFYAAEMVQRIKLHWEIPEVARLGWKGNLTVRFFILADGRVDGAWITRESGIGTLDEAALEAVVKSSPFRPLPQEIHKNREGVSMTFLYNMRIDSPPGSAAMLIPTAVPISARAMPFVAPTAAMSTPLRPRIAKLPHKRAELVVDQPPFQFPLYIEKLAQIIGGNWFRPGPVPVCPVVSFRVERDGTVTNPRILTSSGESLVDRAALRAVLASSPLPPLPADYRGPRLGIQVVFE